MTVRRALTSLKFQNSTIIMTDEGTFPVDPEQGQFCFNQGVLYIYATIEGQETWYPLTNKNQYYIFSQALSSTSWVITHNLSTDDVIFVAYDDNNNQIIPNSMTVDSEDQITLNFVTAELGRAVVFGATEAYVPGVTTGTLDVGNIHMEGSSIEVSGTDIVALLNQVNTDLGAMFSWNQSQGEITFKGDLIPENNETLNIGSSAKKIKDFYVSAQTIHVGDSATFEGTSLAIDAGSDPTSLTETPTIQASNITLVPFTYNPGGGEITARPVLQFNVGGQNYPISFDTVNNKFSFDAQGNHGEGVVVCKDLEAGGTVTADTIRTNGATEVRFDQGLRVDGDVDLGYDSGNAINIRGTVNLQTPITFQEEATLGDGNDEITVNAGAANNFLVDAQNMQLTASKLTVPELESSGDMTVQGDLFVNGTQTIVNTTQLEVTDNTVVVNNGEAGAGITAGQGGIRVDRGTLPDAMIVYDEALDRWQFGTDGSLNDLVTDDHNHDGRYLRANDDAVPDSDNVRKLGSNTSRFSEVNAVAFIGDLTGNADTATAMATLQTITFSGGVSGSYQTDGTGNKNVSLTVDGAGHSHDDQYFTEVESDARFLRRNADSTPDVDIAYDLGDATHRWAQIFAQSFKGNADTASQWQNSRTLTLTGDVTGSVAFDGSGNVSLTATVGNDSHTHDTRYYTQTECNDQFMKLGANNLPDANKTYSLGSDTYRWNTIYGSRLDVDNRIDTYYLRIKDGSEYAQASYDDANNRLAFVDQSSADTVKIKAYQFEGIATSANYADLAEKYSCAEEYVYPGTVMKACETGEYDVEECGSELAKNVIGVASEKPGFLMNEDSEGIVVGLKGRVPVRIVGPVGKGQALVSAGKGCARGIRRENELLYKIGVALEENMQDEEKLVMCAI